MNFLFTVLAIAFLLIAAAIVWHNFLSEKVKEKIESLFRTGVSLIIVIVFGVGILVLLYFTRNHLGILTYLVASIEFAIMFIAWGASVTDMIDMDEFFAIFEWDDRNYSKCNTFFL